MKHTLVIASRELREKSRLFVVGAALSLLPFVAMIPAESRKDALTMASALFALVVGLGVAVMLGSSTIAGELVERRLSFYFTKPIAPAALWFGKLIAALLMSLFCFAVIIGVSAPFAGSALRQIWTAQTLGIAVLGIIVMFLFSHALSTMVRSRSGLIGVDFVLAVLTGLALFYLLRPMLLASAEHTKTLFQLVAAAFGLILFAAPVWQLARGRSDIRRSHAALSRAIWTSVAVVMAILAGYTAWILNVDPSDLRSYGLMQQAPGGNTLFLSGTARGDLYTTFLIDLNSGRHERIPSLGWWGVEFSQDGKTVAWFEPVWRGFGFAGVEVYTKRLDQPGAKAQATGVQTGRRIALSPDGSRLAVLTDQTISVHDVATHRLVASMHRNVPPANAMALFFAGNDVVRIYHWPRGNEKLEILELDTRTKSLVQTGEITSKMIKGLRLNPDGSRLVLARNGIVADGRTGALIATLPVIGMSPYQSAILSDGTIAIIAHAPSGPARLHLFAADGTPLREIAMPVQFVMISGETDGGKLIAIGSDKISDDRTGRGRKTFVIDTNRGAIERTLNDLRGPIPNYGDERLTHYRPDEKLVAVNGEGELVTWNAMTGEVKGIGR